MNIRRRLKSDYYLIRKGIRMSLQNAIVEFDHVIKELRSEHGCPWDREQTHGSLRSCIMEEAAELQAAIRIYEKSGDADNMKEELGDLLLQVVMQSCIAQEEGLFSLEDVIGGIQEKMIRRHPHVFGTINVNNSEEVLKNWEEIKKREKAEQAWVESPLKEIPKELPALTRAPKVLKKIDKLYDKTSTEEVSLKEMKEALDLMSKQLEDKEGLETTISNMLLSLSNLAMRKRVHLEQILNDGIDDLIEVFE